MSIKDRKKASDVFREWRPVFGEKSSFKEAFPEIDDLKIECKETGHLGSVFNNETSHYYSIENPPGEYIDCSNPLCYNGGFSIGRVLREMIRNKEMEKEGSEICKGYEGSPKGRRRYRNCLNFFKYKVKIKYKSKNK